MFIYPDKQIYICIYLYIEIDSPDRNLGDGFMIYSTKKKSFFITSIYPSKRRILPRIYLSSD